jgi:hypothetical protein
MKKTLENTEGAIKNEHSRETGNIGYKRRRKKLHYTQTNTNNVNKTLVPLQPTGGKEEQNIFLSGNRNGHHNTEFRSSPRT